MSERKKYTKSQFLKENSKTSYKENITSYDASKGGVVLLGNKIKYML